VSIEGDAMQHANSHAPCDDWHQILAAGVRAQELISGAIAVGGTAAALYAHHRVSLATDHVLADLRQRFEEVRDTLESAADWKTARVQPPVLLLGSINGVEVGFRQMRRSSPIQSVTHFTSAGPLVIPTLDELIGMKAYLAYSRNATRDYLDFAALTSCANEHVVLASLKLSDPRYGELQTHSVGLEIAKALVEPAPYDLDEVDLTSYKGLKPPWNDWDKVAMICLRFGLLLAEALVAGTEQ
jgi:hypothetical protein